MAAFISDDEKVRARHHLGYPNVESVATFVLGVPAAMQTTFMAEGAFNRVLNTPNAVDKFREMLARLDEIENFVLCGLDLADVDEVGEAKINRKRLPELARYYKIPQQGLANLLGIPPNPFDQRSWLSSGGNINVPVQH